MDVETDRIRRRVVLHAPRDRVWRALSDAGEFGRWFGVRLDGQFEEGAVLHGTIVPTEADAQVARSQEPYRGTRVDLTVDLVEHGRVLSFRWHPHAVGRGVDYSAEPTTVVVFELEDAEDGVRLSVTEWGFDRLPPGRREAAYTANAGGWSTVVTLIAKHLARNGGGNGVGAAR